MLGPNKLPIGYWPSSIVPGLADYAKVIYMGGITQAPHNEPGPPMGSGHFAEEGFSKASSFSGVQYIDANNNFQYPKHHDKYVDESVCYNMGDAFDTDQHNGLAFFFGGPGRCTR
ncbi:hypothetical protein QJS04_geneDACA018174 [Acorus gramineus]|uniref:Neprosin PEP catalytic domain-containing protein n=1 Tax=Acorus gramineus TaxID=55184 RepID=A0AAV9AKM2_ACOGR|nr:hypothetical protein QJS04_geneDACA018174 [Acorus gramineus]